MEYYLETLSLQSIVDGGRLGVAEHHARLMAKGARGEDAHRMLALHNHLELVDVAKKLAPGEVENLPPSVLTSCLTEIIVRQGVIPPPQLESLLFERKMKELSASASDEKTMSVALEVITPWLTSGAPARFDVFKPTLSAMQKEPKDKVHIFLNKVTNSFIVPMILKGPDSRNTLFTFICCLLTRLETAVADEQTDDTYLASAIELAEVLRPLRALMGGSLMEIAKEIAGLATMYQQVGRGGTTFLAVVCTAIKRAQWPMSRLESIIKVQNSIVEAADLENSLDELSANLDGQPLPAQIVLMSDKCRKLTRFQASIDKEFITTLEQRLWEFVEPLVEKIHNACLNNSLEGCDEVPVQVGEFSFAYPERLELMQLEGEVSKSLKQGRHRNLFLNLRSKCNQIVDAAAADGAVAPLVALLPALMSAAGAAKGASCEDEADKELFAKCTNILDSMAWAADDIQDSEKLCEGIIAMSSVLQGGAGETLMLHIDALAAFLEMKRIMFHYKDQDSNIASLIRNNKFDMPLLSAFRSNLAALKSFSDTVKHQNEYESIVREATVMEKRAGDELMSNALLNLDAARDTLRKRMEPTMVDNKLWRDNLPKNPTWSAYASMVSSTIGQVDPKGAQADIKNIGLVINVVKDLEASFATACDAATMLEIETEAFRASAYLSIGAAVALLERPPPDKLVAHRSLQAALKTASMPHHTDFVDDLLITRLRKATSLS